MKQILLLKSLLILAFSSQIIKADVSGDINSLGTDSQIIERARKLDPNNRYRIVQKRKVDRYYRVELSGSLGMSFGGDSYYETSSYGGQLDFHITPRWSIGARYHKFSNELTSEGKRVYDRALIDYQNGDINSLPGNEFPESSILGVINYYPIYGKLNLFNQTTIQFDIYALGGAGVMNIGRSSQNNAYTSTTYTAGGGVGFWINNYITTRFEARYQYYQEKNDIYPDGRDIHLTTLGMNLGVLF